MSRNVSPEEVARLLELQKGLRNEADRVLTAAGRQTAQVGADGSPTYFAYDLLGRQVAVTDALGSSTYYQYDLAGQQVAQADALGSVTYFYYDVLARQYAVRDAADGLVYYQHDALGRRVALKDQRGYASYFAYDVLSRLVSEKDPLGNAEYFLYDAVGPRSASVDPLGNPTYYSYDPLGRLTAVIDPLGNQRAYLYDAAGNRTASVDPLGHAEYYYYDVVGSLTCAEDAAGALTYYEHGSAGDYLAVRDTAGSLTYYNYDPLGRVAFIANPLGQTEYFFYDAKGRVLAKTDASGQTGYYSYDLLGRKVAAAYSAGMCAYFAYDERSAMSAAWDQRGWSYFLYDELTRPAACLEPDGTALYFSYDATGNGTAVGLTGAATTYYEFDEARRMRQADATAAGLGTTYYEFDAAGQVVKKTLGNGFYTYFAYDPARRLTQLLNCFPDGPPLVYFEYAYDAASRIRSVRREDGNVVYYGYDVVDRLTSEHWYDSGMAPLYAFQWDYDPAGNRTYERRGDVETYYTYDEANELLHTRSLPADEWTYFQYDPRGNTTAIQEPDGTTCFSYNALNLVTAIAYKTGVANYFYYDSQLRRYAIEESTGLSYFTWDTNAMDLLCERDAGGVLTANYTHGYTPTDGIGSMTAAKKIVGGTTYDQYPIYDHRGSVMRLVDEAGQLAAAYEYNSWGVPLHEEASGAPNRFRYQSNWFVLGDPAARLFLSPARLYLASIGRFVQRDRLVASHDGEEYSLGGSMATGIVDPSGLAFVGHLRNVKTLTSGRDWFGETRPIVRHHYRVDCVQCNDRPLGCERAKVTGEMEFRIRCERIVLDNETRQRYQRDAEAREKAGDPRRSPEEHYAHVGAHEEARLSFYRRQYNDLSDLGWVAMAFSLVCSKCCRVFGAFYRMAVYLAAMEAYSGQLATHVESLPRLNERKKYWRDRAKAQRADCDKQRVIVERYWRTFEACIEREHILVVPMFTPVGFIPLPIWTPCPWLPDGE